MNAADPTSHYRSLGNTGERVFPIGLGGWHLWLRHVDVPLSHRIVRTAIDRGINFMDNSWDPMTAAEVEALLARTKEAASHGEFELFKTSSIFDATATNPAWLGGESGHVREMMNA